jgi:hypothetical protein
MSENRVPGDEGDDAQAPFLVEDLRRSLKEVEDLVAANRQMAQRLQQLEDELDRSRRLLEDLEDQIVPGPARPAADGGAGAPSAAGAADADEQQNAMVHLFVVSEALADVASPDQAVRAAAEILANLVGARRFGIWFRWKDATRPTLVAAHPDAQPGELDAHVSLVQRCVGSGHVQPSGASVATLAPVCVPLRLDSQVVGACLIVELLPQVPQLGLLQWDLLNLLSNRLPHAVCFGAASDRIANQAAVWSEVRRAFLS